MLVVVAILAASILAVGSATGAPPEDLSAVAEQDPATEAPPDVPDSHTGVSEAASSVMEADPPAESPAPQPEAPASSEVQFPTTMSAGPPRIVEDLTYEDVMFVAGESAQPARAPTLRLIAGIGVAGMLFAGALIAAAKGLDLVFSPLFKIFK